MQKSRVSQYERGAYAPYVRPMTFRMRLIAGVIVIATVASCQNAPSKSGGEVGTATIHTPTGDPNTPGGDLMEHIRSQLGTVSNGAFEVVTGGMPDASELDTERALLDSFVRVTQTFRSCGLQLSRPQSLPSRPSKLRF